MEQTKMQLYATITAYREKLIIELLAKKSIEGVLTTSLDGACRFGHIVHDTQHHLGVSAEALAILALLIRRQDVRGDVAWFKTADNKHHFGWLGEPFAILTPGYCMASMQFSLGSHTVIGNEPAVQAKKAIDNAWRDASR